MNLHQILEELAYDTYEFPREAIEAAIINKKEITPFLLEILEDVLRYVDEVIENDNYQGHLYAIYLLSQFREKRALPTLIKLLSFPDDIPYALLGDVITEDLHRILASLSLNDVDPLFALIENEKINEYVRASSIFALVTLVGCGIIKRKKVIDYFQSLFSKLQKKSSFVWDALIQASTELYPEELFLNIVHAFDNHLINTHYITLHHVRSILQKPKDDQFFHLYQNAELIEDTVTEMEKWLDYKIGTY